MQVTFMDILSALEWIQTLYVFSRVPLVNSNEQM